MAVEPAEPWSDVWGQWHKIRAHAELLAKYGMRTAPPLDYDGLERFIEWLDSELLNVRRRKEWCSE